MDVATLRVPTEPGNFSGRARRARFVTHEASPRRNFRLPLGFLWDTNHDARTIDLLRDELEKITLRARHFDWSVAKAAGVGAVPSVASPRQRPDRTAYPK